MKYVFSKAILAAEGVVVIEVEAPDAQSAIEKAKSDNAGQWVFDQVKVTKFGDPVFLGPSLGKKPGNG